MKQHLFTLSLAALLFAACGNKVGQPIRLQGETQGSYYSIIYYDSLQRNFQPQIDSLLHDFDLTANLWVDSSIIRRINRNEDTFISEMFRDILLKSLEINRYTHGAFNCKIGTLVNLYGFGFENRQDVSNNEIDSILAFIRQDSTIITPTDHQGVYTLRKLPQIEYDFNAIAQGYTSDLIAQMFDRLGLESYLVDIGGEVIAKGTKPNGDNWTVGIERPAETKYSTQQIETAILLNNQSVVTSGNYRKYYEKDGVRYSHTIDPATGHPVSHSLLSVSVVSKESWYADAMATAFMVMGLEKSLQFIEQHPDDPDIQAVYFIYDEHGEYKTFATPKFQEIIKEI
ncbi:MAG: FAD:protein FMN transferase [Bacteroidales bacterium]|nr:FAD:protein FMN transferase [Bacteroidales bacterium]